MDSEGLLLLSDEAGLNDRLLNPKHAHPRTYLVQVEGVPSSYTMKILGEGSIVIRGHRCLPCKVAMLSQRPELAPRNPPIRVRKEIPDTWIRITLTEGKNRQVRRMTAAIGHPTLRLVRIAIGSFSDPSLPPGVWRKLSNEEREQAECRDAT
jgi:23S rRNA pseudouridine2457 synthase